MTRIQRDTLINVCIALACLVFLIWIIPAYTPPHPGYGASPALVPNVVVGVMLVMAILALTRNLMATRWNKALSADESAYPEDGQGSGFTQVGRVNLWHLAKLMIPCALFVPAIEWFGYLPTALGFMLIIQIVIGQRRPLPAITVAVAMVAAMYVAMRYGFNVPVPGT